LPSRSIARLAGALGLVAAMAAVACSDDIDSSGACPLLCAPQSITMRDTVVEGVAFDSTVGGFPGLGLESSLLLASLDSLDTRVVVRFDTLPTNFRAAGNDSAITRVDTATLSLRLAFPLLTTSVPIIVEAYDVDTTANDTLPETLLPLFRPDRLLATELVSPASITDSTVRIFLNTARVLAHVRDTSRLRVGLRVRAGTQGRVSFVSAEGGSPPQLALRVTTDTSVRPIAVSPTSGSPTGGSFASVRLVDYLIVAQQPAAAPPTTVAVGGLRGQRGYLRFALPSRIVDSSTVVRASLLLTQLPYRGPGAADTLAVDVHPTLSSAAVTNVRQIVSLIGPPGLGAVRRLPSDSGLVEVEVADLLRQWRAAGVDSTLRSLVLRAPLEQATSSELRFASRRSANAAIRPRLRLIYVPRTTTGLP
jgi:hypothetical protein